MDSIQNDGALATLIATKCPKDMSCRSEKQRIANYFSNVAQSTVDHSKMLDRSLSVKNSLQRRCKIQKFRSDEKQLTKTRNTRMKIGSPESLIQADKGQNSELVKSSFAPELICSAENMWRQMRYYLYVKEYTGSFYRGSQDGKTCRFTWKSFTSNSWGKSETGLPGQQMQKN